MLPIKIYQTELQDVLVEFKKKAYAGEGADVYKDTPYGTKRFEHQIGLWNFSDEFDGDVYFAGEERLSRNILIEAIPEEMKFVTMKPPIGIWHMIYNGRLLTNLVPKDNVFDFLIKSLQVIPKDLPFRGPLGSFTHEDFPGFEYQNKLIRGKDVTNATGIEEMFSDKKKVYEGFWGGGLLMKKFGNLVLI
jgi:hypothetical protein